MKILVIDDEESVALLIKEYLENFGFEVSSVLSGSEGIEVIKTGGVDLVISDINMPGTNGLDVLEYVQRINSCLPVIMMTGAATDKERQKALELGALGIMEKPFEFSKMIEQIERAMN